MFTNSYECEIMLACELGDIKYVKKMIKNYPNIDVFSERKYNGFVTACKHGNLEIAIWLLAHRPNADISLCYWNAFLYSCTNNKLNVAKWLYSLQKKYNTGVYTQNVSIFIYACRNGLLEVAQWLHMLNKPPYFNGFYDYVDGFYEACYFEKQISHWLKTVLPFNFEIKKGYGIKSSYETGLLFIIYAFIKKNYKNELRPNLLLTTIKFTPQTFVDPLLRRRP